ncbi:MAG TPA: hypothetical protein DCZ92_07995 [Elusimicrobia bacterium]|nr:hypothetical protein [Elusimicrobiota bacterium]
MEKNTDISPETEAPEPFSFKKAAPWLLPAAVALAAFIAFSGALKNGFVNWDDDVNLVLNNSFRGLAWANIKWMFTTFHMGHYQPLSWLTFALDHELWGMDPAGFHLTNVLLHALNAAVFYFLALSLLKTGAADLPEEKKWALLPSAAFAALVFALHPLRAESVAWATERRDMLSGLFYLLTLLYYLKACAQPAGPGRSGTLRYSLLFYALSLLSKGMGVSLPAILITLDFYPLKRLPAAPRQWLSPEARAVWLEKVPFALLSLAAGAIGLAAQVTTGATDYKNIVDNVDFGGRVVQALYGLAFYLWKTVAPWDLLPLYERAFRAPPFAPEFLLPAVGVAACTIAFFLLRRRRPYLLAAWVIYIATLLPVLQIVPFGPYIVADRYSYLACLAWAVLAGGALLSGLAVCGRAVSQALLFFALALALLLGWRSAAQTRVWRDSGTLWLHVLASNPGSSIAHSNLGCLLLDEMGRPAEAHDQFVEAIRLRPDYGYAYYNYGNALAALGRLEESIPQFRHAVRLMPDYANAFYNLGNSLIRLGRTDEAITQYREAVRVTPDYAAAHHNLGTALLMKKDLAGALREYREAHRLNPSDLPTCLNLAHALARLGQSDEALEYYSKAVSLAPANAQARSFLEQAQAARRR